MNLTPDVARAVLAFLGRTELKGNEAPTFMQVVQILTRIAETEDKDQRNDVPSIGEPSPAEAPRVDGSGL